MFEHHLVAVKLTEQLGSETILMENNFEKLNEKVEILATISRYFRKHFLSKGRLSLGKHKNSLIDPFGHATNTNKILLNIFANN